MIEFPNWLHTRIVLSGELLACVGQLAAGKGDPQEAARLLAELERDPIDIDADRTTARPHGGIDDRPTGDSVAAGEGGGDDHPHTP